MGLSNIDSTPTEKSKLLTHSGDAESNTENEGQGRRRLRTRSRTRSIPYSTSQSLTGALARSTSISRRNTVALVVGDSSDTVVPSLWSSSRTQWAILFALFISNIFSFMCLAIMAPFFPAEAEKKGMSSAISGWVFGIFSLVQFGFAPVVGKLIPVVGSKFLLLSGTFFGGGCTILFGFMDRVPVTDDNNMTFIALCFILRIFLALGCTACSTATFAIATNTFPANASTALGFLETAIGVGLMSGPALGGILYEAGGFLAPFVAVGAAMVATCFLFWCILPSKNGSGTEEQPGSILDLLRVPVIFLIMVTIIVTALLWVALDPILEPNLRQYGLTPSQLGLVFLLLSGTYAILAPISGRIADKLDNSTPLMIIGFAVLTIGLLLLGPSPVLGLQEYNRLWLVLVSLVILGVGVSLTIVPTYDKVLTSAGKAGIPDTIGTHGAVAGLWTSVYALGEFFGPIYSGAAYEAIGFSWTTTIMALATFLMFFLTIAIYIYERGSCCKGPQQPSRYLPMKNDEATVVMT